MTSATANLGSIDFRAIAKEIAGSNRTIQAVRELVPAEAAVRQQREGNRFMRRPSGLGATVDQEGLINNYGIEPVMYYANFPYPEQIQRYLVQGGGAVLLISTLLLTAFAVS